MAALAVAMTLMFGSLAFARDHDYDRDHNKDRHDHWDKHSDRDRHHDRDHDQWRGQDHNRDRARREQHNDGYYGGQVYNRYPRNYPNAGNPSGGYGYPGGGYPSGGYGYPGSVYGRSGGGRNTGYNVGYQDGGYMARKDMSQNKPFNPNPRNEYGNRDRGYDRSFGDKNYYRSQYTSGYASGYQASYRGGRGWGY